MVGGSLDGLDPHTFTRTVSGDGHIWVDPNKVAMDFQNLQQDLESHQTVLVGHNLFLDLINFYKCFIGALPDTVEQFSAAIHKLFPLIVDTKYMSAELHHETGQLGIEHNLEEIFAQMMNIEVPYIGKTFVSLVHRLLTFIQRYNIPTLSTSCRSLFMKQDTTAT